MKHTTVKSGKRGQYGMNEMSTHWMFKTVFEVGLAAPWFVAGMCRGALGDRK